MVACCSLAQPLLASTVIFRTDAQLVALSERVVHGRVIAERTALGSVSGTTIYTVTTIQVIEDLTGVPGDSVEVWELGGVLGDAALHVGGRVEYALGSEVLVCLERGPMGLRSVAMGFSKFDVLGAVNGDRLLRRNVGETVVVGGATARERTLNEFRAVAVEVTGRSTRMGQAAARGGESGASAPFTKLGGEPGYRWVQADSGTPVLWYRNTSAPSPLTSGDGTSEIQTALAAWTNPASASVVLQYGGTTAQPDADGPWTGLPSSGLGVITFEDPNNELSGSTLAIGGAASAVGYAGGTVNGTTFHAIQRGFVIFQNAADLGASFRQSLNFTRVLTHEIGHAIGLGHTQADGSVPNPTTNLMYASCCYSGMPVPPAIGPDDLAGLNFIYPAAGATCSYTVNPTAATAPAAGGAGSVSVTTQSGCTWTAATAAAFLTITGGSSGTGSGTVSYSVAGNGASQRSGMLTVAGHAFTVTQSGSGPTMTLEQTALRFGATVNGTSTVARTSAQVVRMAQTGAGTVSWTATASQPWLQVSPASGSGPATFSIAVAADGLPAGTFNATVTIAVTGAGNSVGPIAVTLAVMPHATSANPIGVLDTPADNATGITGAIPFTGWALDDLEIASVFLCRNAAAGEAPAADGHCGGAQQVFVGTGVFIDGARPDVQGAFSTYPRNSASGWGFMLLTNMLPGQGNGTFVFHAYATDVEGHIMLLGSRRITCDNAHATLPFGTLDTPGQGETVSGAAYVNFGWALTQAGKSIPTDGSTITVFVDGASVGTASYNHYRSDIATLFPGLANSDGAIGFRTIDTTRLANGLHTIVWTVTDSGGATAGLGSRYFRVANGATAASTAAEISSASTAATATSPATVATLPIDATAILGRRGWAKDAPWQAYAIGSSGRAVMRGEEIDRIELALGERPGETYRGYLRIGDALSSLPVGSQLNAKTGAFTWSPGLGFIGTYDLVFVRSARGQALAQQQVRVILRPKSTGYVGTQVEIDTPQTRQVVGQPFVVAGWAADLDAASGTGIDTLHVWAYPTGGGDPIFLGTASMGGPRADVASIHGDQFRNAGFGLLVQGLGAGTYDVAVFPWSNVAGGFAPPKVVRVTVQ